MEKLKKGMSLMLIFVLALSMTLTTGCSKKDDKDKDKDVSKQLVVTVNDKKLYMDEIMYYIYLVELQGSQYDQMYRSYFGTGYWDTEYEEGIKIRDKMKTYIMDSAVMNEILYEKAIAEKYKLTDEELATNKENVATILEQITKDQQKTTGLTKDKLMEMHEKLAIAYKYQKDIIDSLDIDDAAIKAGVKKEDYRQYNTEYMLFPTSSTDEEGSKVDFTDEQKKEQLNNAKAALKAAKAGTAFSEIVAKYEGAVTNTANFVVGDETTEAAYEKAAVKLKNNEYGEILKTEIGYYVFKMVDNNSSESYDAAVEQAITQEETTRFNAEYEKMKKDYKIKVNNKVWDPIVIGNITVDASAANAATGAAATDTTTGTDTEAK